MRKKFIAAILVITLILLSTNAAVASAESITTDSLVATDLDSACQKALYKLVAAENSQDWETFCNMFTKDQVEHEKEYFKSDKESGVKSVKSAQIVEIQFLDTDIYISNNTNSRSYIIGVDYTVTQEDKYYINGVNYHIITLQLENNEWKVLEYQDAPLEIFITDNKSTNETRAEAMVKVLPGLHSQNVKTMLDIIDARAAGIIINAKGEYLSSNSESINSAEEAQEMLELVKTERATAQTLSQTRPSWIVVYTVDETDIGDMGVQFTSYCKWVLPNEWYSSWPTQSLRAGAMVIAQYGAYHVLHPRHTSVGCDVCDSSHCQVFRYDSGVSSCDNAVEATKSYYYTTSGGTFFETCYAAGSYSSAYGHTGRMRQNGSHYWADYGNTWTWMMDYYYSDSSYNITITDIVRHTW